MNFNLKLEEDIMRAWSVTDQIELVMRLYDKRELSYDELINLLSGIKAISQANFEVLWNTFEQSLKK